VQESCLIIFSQPCHCPCAAAREKQKSNANTTIPEAMSTLFQCSTIIYVDIERNDHTIYTCSKTDASSNSIKQRLPTKSPSKIYSLILFSGHKGIDHLIHFLQPLINNNPPIFHLLIAHQSNSTNIYHEP